MTDGFYIGYEPEMPAALSGRIRAVAIGLLLLAMVLPIGLVLAQGDFAVGIFEYGHERVFDGRIVERPYPLLVDSSGRRYFLVGPGKHGAAAIAKGFDGRLVRARGTLIQRDGDRMLQVPTGGIEGTPAAPRVAPGALARRGDATLRGEIVDSKCHLGVMKPGEGPLHRDCAVRCLLGGAPPLLVVSSGRGTRRIALVAADGGPLTVDLEAWTARPVLVRGVVYGRGDEEYLGVTPNSFANASSVRNPARAPGQGED
jgi:hypothetical protein